MTTSRFSAVSRRAFLGGMSLAALTGLAACADSSSATSASGSTAGGAASAPASAATSTATSSGSAAAGGTLPDGATATVSFTYAASNGGAMVKNPYYAVWVEDAAGNLVKTLLLCHLSGEDRWLNELSAWYQASGGGDTTTEGTKPAGSYDATWDGTDASGQRVAAGSYTICVEANREHGQESLVTSTQTLGSSALDVDLGSNGELSATHLKYTL